MRMVDTFPILSASEVREIAERLRVGLQDVFPGESMEIIVYGSYARGEAAPGSDLDIMVLVDASREEIAARGWDVSGVSSELSISCGVTVSPLVENRTFFQSLLPILPFFQNVMREGIRLDE